MTWILFPLVIVHYVLFLQPLLWTGEGADITIPIIFGLSLVTVCVGVHMTCSINPCDTNLLPVDDPRRKCVKAVPQDESEDIYCYVCEKAVNKTSKHCKFCRKCITAFDHHCKWLNTCIGVANYRYFVTAVFGITVTTSVSLALSLAYVVESWAYPGRIQTRGEESYMAISLLGTRVVSVISAVFLVPLVAMVYQLAGFHIMLLSEGLTTYEYIIRENKKQKARREKAAAEMKAKRDELRAKSMAAFGNIALSGLNQDTHDNAVKNHLEREGRTMTQLEQQVKAKKAGKDGMTGGPGTNLDPGVSDGVAGSDSTASKSMSHGGSDSSGGGTGPHREGIEMQAAAAIASPDSPPPLPGDVAVAPPKPEEV